MFEIIVLRESKVKGCCCCCFGFSGPLRQYFSLYRAEGDVGRCDGAGYPFSSFSLPLGEILSQRAVKP